MLSEKELRKAIRLENEKNKSIVDDLDNRLHKSFVMGMEFVLDD